jgi:acetyl-CoA C-acetyltransferase
MRLTCSKKHAAATAWATARSWTICSWTDLEDAYERGTLMGVYADETARTCQITRTEQDNFALASLSRATAATKGGDFAS